MQTAHSFSFHQLFNPLEFLHNSEISSIIVPLILIMVFIETGLLFPFLPGDSLLFASGIVAAEGIINLWELMILIPITAFAGDNCAYMVGNFWGKRLLHKPDSRFFKHEWLDQSQTFFTKHGAKAIILARFVPIIRTFSAVIAGISHMKYTTFVIFDALGALLWGCGVIILGYWLGKIEFIHDNIELILVILVIITLIPAIVKSCHKYFTRS